MMGNYKKTAGTSQHMRDYMEGRITEEEYAARMKKETSTIVRSALNSLGKQKRASSFS